MGKNILLTVFSIFPDILESWELQFSKRIVIFLLSRLIIKASKPEIITLFLYFLLLILHSMTTL